MKYIDVTKKKTNTLGAILAVFSLLGALIAGIFYLSTFPEVREQWRLATTIIPETFTELYFEDHLSLPKTIQVGEDYTFSFTIRNLEYKTMTYPYELYIDYSGKREKLNSGTVTLKHDEKKTILQSFEIVAPVSRAKVSIYLINKQQAIHFWMEGANK